MSKSRSIQKNGKGGQSRSIVIEKKSNTKKSTAATSKGRGKNGNTNPSPLPDYDIPVEKILTVKKQAPLLKNWFFTWNNYPEGSIDLLISTFQCKKLNIISYTFQKEIGDSGTPHIQGCINLSKKARPSEFNLPKQIHWEKVRNNTAAMDYCKKEESRDGVDYWEWPKKATLRVFKKSELKPWMRTIIVSIDMEPDERTINWVYDEKGGIGKTKFSKYLYATHKNIIYTSESNNKDVSCMLSLLEKSGTNLNEDTTFIFDLPRNINTQRMDYQCLENCKDGAVFSPKYESNTLMFNCPHIWVFSNSLPNLKKMSGDRWKIWCIEDEQLVKYELSETVIKDIIYKKTTKLKKALGYDSDEDSEHMFI